MDYEQKYKEVLERAKEFYALCEKCGAKDTVDFLEGIFPELKENKDERVRKGLIKAVSRTFEGSELYGSDVTREEALSWLEKQGDKDKLIKELGKYKVKYTQEVLSQQLEKQGEQKVPVVDFKAKDWYVSKIDGKIHNAKFMEKTPTNQASEKQGKQKPQYDRPAWSEEDEKNLQGIVDEIQANKSSAPSYDINVYDRYLSWLESIKQRIGG